MGKPLQQHRLARCMSTGHEGHCPFQVRKSDRVASARGIFQAML
jgi:hypothetical protein